MLPALSDWGRENPDPTGERLILQPFLPSVNAYDAIARPHEVSDWGPFEWAGDMSAEDWIEHIPAMTTALAYMHSQGKVVGEAILPNLVFTEDGLPIWVDAEVSYRREIPTLQQHAFDLRNLTLSLSSSLRQRMGAAFDTHSVVTAVVNAYPEPAVLQQLAALLEKPLPWCQRLAMNEFMRYRIGAGSNEQYEHVRHVLREQISRVLEGK
ncbi:MAG: hypothetical protein HY817_02525 [Candidatus Abawacabacteria bacterium]|nr:hypothetical protein [Candidatus Abawacabacteria bacterium]